MRFTLTAIICLMIGGLGLAQNSDIDFNEGKEATIKPRLGLGVGAFTYLGDVQDDYFKSILSSSFGFEVSAARNLSHSFDIELKVLYGNIKINPRVSNQDFNFHTILWNGNANLVYNFNGLYKKPAIVKPFLSIGVGYLSFDSKTDMYNAAGQQYHYWSDGSIRSLDENDPLASTATVLYRDYEYETDLRYMNADGLGKYERSAISIPGTVGLNFKVSPRVNFRLSSTYYYNFTDLVDNISDAGEGRRAGNSANDNFLYHSFSLSYNLYQEKSPKTDYFDQIAFDDIMAEDEDGDGVMDIDDMCAGTPKGVKVLLDGCPEDSDEDGVPNYLDKQPKTPIGMSVDAEGVAINFEQVYEERNDTLIPLNRNLLTDKHIESVADGGKKYTVHVGTFTNKIPDELKQVLRTIRGLKEDRINDTLTVFTVGDYENFDDAEKLTQDLRKRGVDEAFGVKNSLVNSIATELDLLEKGALKTEYLYFRVEFDEYRERIPFDRLSGFIATHGIEMRITTGGLKIYSMGKFSDYLDAARVMEEIEKLGVKEPRVEAFLNGTAITVEEALELFEKPQTPNDK